MITEVYSGDVQPLIELFSVCFDGDADTARAFFKSRRVTLVAFDDDRKGIIGMVNLVPTFTDSAAGFYIYGACVAPEHRGKGVFNTLMKTAEELAENRGCKFLCLIPANEAIADKYRRLGYITEVRRYRKGDKSQNGISCLTDFSAFASNTGDNDNAYRCGLLLALDGSKVLSEPCFENYMGEI